MFSLRLVHILTLEHFSFHCIPKRTMLWHLCICRFSVLTFCIMESLHISLHQQGSHTALLPVPPDCRHHKSPSCVLYFNPPPITCALSHTHNTLTQVPLSEKRNVLIGNNSHNSVTSLFLLNSACGFTVDFVDWVLSRPSFLGNFPVHASLIVKCENSQVERIQCLWYQSGSQCISHLNVCEHFLYFTSERKLFQIFSQGIADL